MEAQFQISEQFCKLCSILTRAKNSFSLFYLAIGTVLTPFEKLLLANFAIYVGNMPAVEEILKDSTAPIGQYFVKWLYSSVSKVQIAEFCGGAARSIDCAYLKKLLVGADVVDFAEQIVARNDTALFDAIPSKVEVSFSRMVSIAPCESVLAGIENCIARRLITLEIEPEPRKVVNFKVVGHESGVFAIVPM